MKSAGERGFSLIELLVVAGVFALMVLMVDAFFATVNRSSHTVEMAADVQQNARVALERLSREAREANVSQVTISSPSSTLMIVFPSARPANSNLEFCVNATGVNSNNCVAPSGGYTGTYAAVPQRWVIYWIDPASTGRDCATGTGLLRRTTQDATGGQPAPTTLPASGDTIATCVALFPESSATKTADRLTVTLILKTAGMVSGAVIPPQTLAVTSTTFMRNLP